MTETAADGVIVGAVGGEEAVQAAEVVAVLLASRLTTPVAAASLTDPGSIKDAAARLRQAVPRVALAPCMVGPELTSGTLEAIAALTTTDCAPPLGSHPAVGKLVAIRYGAALAESAGGGHGGAGQKGPPVRAVGQQRRRAVRQPCRAAAPLTTPTLDASASRPEATVRRHPEAPPAGASRGSVRR